MNAGSLVKFASPMADEAGLVFVVVENNGNRLLVRHEESPMSIKPTFVYLATDLTQA